MRHIKLTSASWRLVRSVLEVERKFIPAVALSARLKFANKETPAFKQLVFTGKSSFEDVYYDYKDMLFNRGLWVRNRTGAWQAKLRCGGNFTNSQFQEFSDVKDIGALVEEIIGRSCSEENAFGLEKFAQFVTERQSWEADNEFEIVVDETDFGHCVGEVELKRVFCENGVSTEMSPADVKELGQRLDNRIACFMQEYKWLWVPGNPVGKLAAYCALKGVWRRPGPHQ